MICKERSERWNKRDGTKDRSSNVLYARAQIAPNDPYFGAVGRQSSVPWSDESRSQVYLGPMSHTPKCTLVR